LLRFFAKVFFFVAGFLLLRLLCGFVRLISAGDVITVAKDNFRSARAGAA